MSLFLLLFIVKTIRKFEKERKAMKWNFPREERERRKKLEEKGNVLTDAHKNDLFSSAGSLMLHPQQVLPEDDFSFPSLFKLLIIQQF